MSLTRLALGPSVLLLALECSCSISPQPLPPVDLNVGYISLSRSLDGGFVLVGGPGAVTPGGAAINLTNLNVATADQNTSASADGQFSLSLSFADVQQLRLTASTEDASSAPFDFSFRPQANEDSERLTALEPPLGSCLHLENRILATAKVGGDQALAVELKNDCDQDVTIGIPSTRTPLNGMSSPFVLSNRLSTLVRKGQSLNAFAVFFQPVAAGTFTDVVSIPIEGSGGARFISLRGTTE